MFPSHRARVTGQVLKLVLSSILLLASGLFATAQQVDSGQSGINKYCTPVTDGDDIRCPLYLSPAVWQLLDPLAPVSASDGRVHLAYVLQVSARFTSPLAIQSFAVVDPDKDNQPTGTNRVVTVSGTDVTGKILPFMDLAPTVDSEFTNVLDAGETSLLYFDVTYPDRQSVPAHISHKVTVGDLADYPPTTTYTAIGQSLAVSQRDPIVLTPPLRGPRWLDGNSCCVIAPHRTVIPINGRPKTPENFAIDFVQLNTKGVAYTGDPTDLKSYPYYGANIYSSSSGTVVEVVRDLPNSIPGANPPPYHAGYGLRQPYHHQRRRGPLYHVRPPDAGVSHG